MEYKYYWEDFQPGMVSEAGGYLVTEEEILEFARKYDPQPFHVDAVVAAGSQYGGLIASGWMTASICMRLACDAVLLESAGMGSPGLDELRWTKPVRAGDVLSLKRVVLETRASKSRPEIGSVRSRSEIYNQRGELVMHITNTAFIRRRNPGAAPGANA